ncbi:MAG: DUF1565 domain-containing protein [Synechococcales bacterium]|nr:DUF1565 domain-containing protein [Synechococcales bacterium]
MERPRQVMQRAGLAMVWFGSLWVGVASTVSLPTIAAPRLQAGQILPADSGALGGIEGVQLAQIPAGATVLYVSSALGQDSATAGTNEATPFKTITFALQQAQPGTVIKLASGSYTKDSGEVFPLRMTPGVSLLGDEPNKGSTTTIIGGGALISPTFARQNVTIAASTGEIRGVNVTNPLSRGTGIWVEGVSPAIVNSTFANSVREGIFVSGGSNPTIEDNVFLNNQGNGISIDFNAQGMIRNNIMQDTGFGLAIGGTATPLVEGNRITNNQDGIYLNKSARPKIRKNVITNNRRDGVVITASAQPDLGTTGDEGGNTIRNNGKLDVNNAGTLEVSAIGNNIDAKKIAGKVIFVAKDTGEPTDTTTFADVKGHWAESYIVRLAAANVITGFPDGSFKPEAPVTRAQFAAIVNKAFTPAPRRAAVEYSDVAKNFWGYGAIQTASRGGFMAGYPGGLFKPEQRIPRVQALVAIANGLEFGAGNVAILAKYKDGSAIPSYASGAIAAATQRRVVVNYPNLAELNPNREATRAEVAAFVYQALVNAGKLAPIPSPYIVNP